MIQFAENIPSVHYMWLWRTLSPFYSFVIHYTTPISKVLNKIKYNSALEYIMRKNYSSMLHLPFLVYSNIVLKTKDINLIRFILK